MGFAEYYRAFPTYTDINSQEYRDRLENLEPLLMKYMKRRGKVLDLACGVGGFSFLLEDYGFEVVGLDISEEMISKAKMYAKEKSSNVEFIIGDAKKLPFEDNNFDYVIFIDSLVHFSPLELNQVFKEVKRVLKPTGKFIIYFTDMRELLPRLRESLVVGEKYWINKIIPDQEEKTVVIEFKSEENSFRVRFNVWGKTGVELLAKLYFNKEAQEKVGNYSYFIVYTPK
ncbi:class I SAM-dependent methyltransferase [Pyrococcus abyssi]|uniref:SAM-dependent methyltransferase, ubiE/COQ5 family n=1 Tax=Pyrococcus abyssi (strain GE5 / Orsay) TaxID=272844 RepID=Q9V268_PYRAB|nr:class I SAM-dependent methyltransferase [Pyrococcus abyssi]CAB49130.1 SAM-dependent methyltransferase, ubiE/COQ5 family [Pyrococcus abyssi GE5]CCE69582.1 TPA: sterol biosynthesis methyltransferase related [Pyrococcus abyssi GE5]